LLEKPTERGKDPTDPEGSETQENRSRNPTLRRDPDPILQGSSLEMVPVAISGGSGRKSGDFQ